MEEEKVEQVEESSATAVVEEPQQEPQQEDRSNKQAFNWEQARGVMAAQKAEIDALKAHLGAISASRPQQQEEPDEVDKLEPGEVPTVEQTRRMIAKEAKKQAEAIVQERLQTHNLQLSEQRIRDRYEDYDYVVENYALPLIKNDPALAYQVKNSSNPAETAYRLGKLSDKYQEASTQQPVSPKAEKVMKNLKRPVSANAVGSTLKSQVDDIQKMSPSQVWELSQKYARGA